MYCAEDIFIGINTVHNFCARCLLPSTQHTVYILAIISAFKQYAFGAGHATASRPICYLRQLNTKKCRLSQGNRSYFIFLYSYSVFLLLPKLPKQSVPSAAAHFCTFEMSWMHSSCEATQTISFMTLSSSVTKFVVKKICTAREISAIFLGLARHDRF